MLCTCIYLCSYARPWFYLFCYFTLMHLCVVCVCLACLESVVKLMRSKVAKLESKSHVVPLADYFGECWGLGIIKTWTGFNRFFSSSSAARCTSLTPWSWAPWRPASKAWPPSKISAKSWTCSTRCRRDPGSTCSDHLTFRSVLSTPNIMVLRDPIYF